jgi:hypothetical protein
MSVSPPNARPFVRLSASDMPQHDKDDEFFFVLVNLHANTDFGTLGTGQVNPGVSRVEIHHNG